MKDKEKKENRLSREVLEYHPDAVEIEERQVSGKVRWVLYLILGALVLIVVGAIVFKVDRFVVAEGKLITTSPTIVVQSLNTAMIRSINVKVGDIVKKNQVLVTLDPTFASADLSQLRKKGVALGVQIRRIQAELDGKAFSARPGEGEDGRLQEQVYHQQKSILKRNKQLTDDKIATLRAKSAQNAIQEKDLEKQLKVLRDVEGTTAMKPQTDNDYRLRLLDARKSIIDATSQIDNLKAQEKVIDRQLHQTESDWHRFVAERNGKLVEQEVQLRDELEKNTEDLSKAKRMHELVVLRSPQDGVVLKIEDRSIGSILRPAEPFMTLVPVGCAVEADVNVPAKDVGRIRAGDSARIKLSAFPFQRHGTLPGKVRVISDDAFSRPDLETKKKPNPVKQQGNAYYRTRIKLLSVSLRNVPKGFRLIPGMEVRAEIKIGKRSVISYFLYPIIRALDESMREP